MMTKIFLKTSLIAPIALLLIAASPKADLNQDGEVTKAEFTQSAQSRFFAADTNNDSFLNEDEREALRDLKPSERAERRFQKLDTNGDNLISHDEMDARVEAMKAKKEVRKEARKAKALERFDTDLDGKLSDAERTVMRAEKKEQRNAKKAEYKADRGDRKKRKRGKRPIPDANGDGFVSLEEYMTVSEQLFERMDANSDGVLTKGEGRKRKGKRRPKRAQTGGK